MADQLSIGNRSLLLVGARTQVSSITPSDGSPEANAISVLFQPTFEALGRTAPWNCLRKQITLSLLAAAAATPENPNGTSLPIPPVPWLYAYAYPSDCLQFRYLLPSLPAFTGSNTPPTTINNSAYTVLPNGGQIPYLISTSTDASGNPITIVLTNQSQAVGVYSFDQNNPAGWDSLFQAAMVASLGAYLVPALSLSLPLMQLAIKTAEEAIKTARVADGNEGVTTMDHTPDWIYARLGGSGWGPGAPGGFTTIGGFVSMTWPDAGWGGGGTYGT